MSRTPLSFSEVRDIITGLVIDAGFKTDKERAIYVSGLKSGIVCGNKLNDNQEVATFINAIDLHLKAFDPFRKIH